MYLRLIVTLLVAAALGGCAAGIRKGGPDSTASINVPAASSQLLVLDVSGPAKTTGSSDWQGFKEEWREAFATQTRAAGMSFRMLSGEPAPRNADGVLVSVRVDDYRFIRPGTRFGLGIMTGNAFVESTIRFTDLKSGALFGEQPYSTSSSAWEGVFSAMTNKQVEAIAVDVVKQIKPR